ncbi:tRNA(fMet)-specific endonuclease VapC [Pedobacter sp. UYP30]|uniref:type II toxin-antitoxin system VapC family toxin n=1 Tax=Pedobacter sp. UYP30 TaxID=1756400 RepID=UPI0033955DA1
MILCDTNILIEIYRGNTFIIEIVKQIGQENIAVSDVTRAELLYGARNLKELQTIRKDLNKLTVLPIQSSISSLAIELVVKYALSHKLSLPDALIASTAIAHKLALYTLNLKDFKFLDGVRLFDDLELTR